MSWAENAGLKVIIDLHGMSHQNQSITADHVLMLLFRVFVNQVHREARTGEFASYFRTSIRISIDYFSYDNSGHKMTYPTWQTKQENVERTEKCIETIAGLFAGNSSIATTIAPLNE